jgi:hypothetical protein
MFKKNFMVLILVFLFTAFCFADENETVFNTIYGWRAEGTFSVNIFKIISRVNSSQIENNINYGEAFLYSSENYSEYILLVYLKNGGRIEIKLLQDNPITEQSMFTDYSNIGENIFSEYANRLLINGYGTFKEFDKNSRLIREERFNNVQGMRNIYLQRSGQQINNMANVFHSEGVYKLTSDSEIIEITITINSQY